VIAFRSECRFLVKLRRTQYEHMFSGSASNSDIAQCSRHFAFVPIASVPQDNFIVWVSGVA
jgi:hypothetical protein